MASTADIEHLLRRTEYVARPDRVSALVPLSIEDAVANVLAVPANPGSVSFIESADWQRGVELTHYWLDRMAHDSPRPIQEKMGFFWHGHFCSDLTKAGSAVLMREQIDLFRRDGLGNLRDLAIEMSTQVAMLRYLDNNRNKASSPNQNFARELMELFLLGVGNYTEADVEAATAAWTGHTDEWQSGAYVWKPEWHDGSTKSFLGRTINQGGDPTGHAAETIEVILGNGTVPSGATVVANRGRPTREVAAEFVSRKLWAEFAGSPVPPAVLADLRTVAVDADFELRPWLTELLTHPAFYSDQVRSARVRTPVEFVVAALVATGHRSVVATPLWSMKGMGQRPLFPPNVSGWKHNGYWVNAGAMAKRTETARNVAWHSMRTYWDDGGVIRLAGGTISRTEVIDTTYSDDPSGLLDRLLELMRLDLTPASYSALRSMLEDMTRWERADVLPLILMTPEFHLA